MTRLNPRHWVYSQFLAGTFIADSSRLRKMNEITTGYYSFGHSKESLSPSAMAGGWALQAGMAQEQLILVKLGT
jgi:hypothetical protein